MTQRTVKFELREIADLAAEVARRRLGITGPHAWAFDLVVGADGEWGFDIIVEDGRDATLPSVEVVTPLSFELEGDVL